jgi:hypothetical protein
MALLSEAGEITVLRGRRAIVAQRSDGDPASGSHPCSDLGLQRGRAIVQLLTGFAAGAALFGLVVPSLLRPAVCGRSRVRPRCRGPRRSAACCSCSSPGSGSEREEVLFRGFLLQGIGVRSLWLGVAVQAVLFAVAHQQALGSPVALLNLVLFAVFTALWVLRQGSLWSVIAFTPRGTGCRATYTGIAVSGTDVPRRHARAPGPRRRGRDKRG